jgi:hypothetical protein
MNAQARVHGELKYAALNPWGECLQTLKLNKALLGKS